MLTVGPGDTERTLDAPAGGTGTAPGGSGGSTIGVVVPGDGGGSGGAPGSPQPSPTAQNPGSPTLSSARRSASSTPVIAEPLPGSGGLPTTLLLGVLVAVFAVGVLSVVGLAGVRGTRGH